MDPANKQPRIARQPAAYGNERSMPRVWRTIINEGRCRQIADDEPRIAGRAASACASAGAVNGGGGCSLTGCPASAGAHI